MRSNPSDFELATPRDLSEALSHIARGARPFAGGTDLMVAFVAGRLPWKHFVNLWKLRELKGIRRVGATTTVGALTTYSDVLKNSRVIDSFPLLARAAGVTGAKAIQNRGTLGGNIANASPAADSPPALLVYEAQLELISERGTRWVPYTAFHTDYKKTLLGAEEIIANIQLPELTKKWRSYYRKVGTRNAQAISKLVMAGVVNISSGRIHDVRLAVGSLAPTPKRCNEVEVLLKSNRLTPALIQKARETLPKDIAPIDDIRSTREYRVRVAQNCLSEFLEGLL